MSDAKETGEKRTPKRSRARPIALALVGLALVAIAGLRFGAPALLVGGELSAACAAAEACGGGESTGECIARAADRVLTFRRSERDGECARCVTDVRCEYAATECAQCEGIVSLPEPLPVGPTPGPLGTSADDMVQVIPSLFPRPTTTAPPPPSPGDLTGLEGLDDP